MPLRLCPLALLILTASLALTGCAAMSAALAVARPVVGAVCMADGFAPIAAAPVPWADPRVVDALIALAAAGRAPGDVEAQRTLAARVAALPSR